MSDVRCHMLHVTCTSQLLLTPTATATDPPPASTTSNTQQDAAVDLDLDPSIMICKGFYTVFYFMSVTPGRKEKIKVG